MYTFTNSYLKKFFLKVQFEWKWSNNRKAALLTSKHQGAWMTIPDNSKYTHKIILLTSEKDAIYKNRLLTKFSICTIYDMLC